MGILTNRIAFSGTATGADVVHMVDVSDTTDGPDGTSFKTPLSALTAYFSASDTYTTGFTYDNANTFTISQNEGQPPLSSTFNTVTGLTSTGTITTNTLSSTTINATSITTNTLSATTISATTISATTIDVTTITVSVSPISVGGGLTWVTETTTGGSQYFPPPNYGYVSRNGHPSNQSFFTLPTTGATTVNIGDVVKVVCMSGVAALNCDASQIIAYGTGNNNTGGSFTAPDDFYFGTGESVEAVYMGDNQWVIDNFMTMEFNLDITTRIFT